MDLRTEFTLLNRRSALYVKTDQFWAGTDTMTANAALPTFVAASFFFYSSGETPSATRNRATML